MIARHIIPTLALALLLPSCSAPGAPAYRIVDLPSGEQVKVIGIAPLSLRDSGTALVLRYQTDVSIDDTRALRAEAARIWVGFQKEADKANVTSAVISANAAPSGGLIRHTQGYHVAYIKDSTGSWSSVR